MERESDPTVTSGARPRRVLFGSAGVILWAALMYGFGRRGMALTWSASAFAFVLCMLGAFLVGEFMGVLSRAYVRHLVRKHAEGPTPQT